MSEPRWNDAGTRPLSRDTPDPYPGPRTRYGRAEHDRQPPAERAPRWGALPSRRGIVLVIGGSVLGTVLTVVTGGEPGFVLGFFLVIASLAASFAVDPRAVYRLIPVPALAYLGGAVIAGLIHDGAADTNRTALAISAAQWFARGFLAMTIATVLVILIGTARWGRLWRRYGTVTSPSAFGPRSAAGRRSTGRLSGADRLSSATGSRTARGPRSAGRPSGATGTTARPGPRGPRTSAGGGDRRRSTPPGTGH